MNEQNQRDSIMSMARGAFEERVDYEMDKVIQNILDPNTKATARRPSLRSQPPTPSPRPSMSPLTATASSSSLRWCRRCPAK